METNDESYADVDLYTEGLIKENAELERKLAVARRGLEKLACLGNEERRGTSYGNSVAIDALKRIDETL